MVDLRGLVMVLAVSSPAVVAANELGLPVCDIDLPQCNPVTSTVCNEGFDKLASAGYGMCLLPTSGRPLLFIEQPNAGDFAPCPIIHDARGNALAPSLDNVVFGTFFFNSHGTYQCSYRLSAVCDLLPEGMCLPEPERAAQENAGASLCPAGNPIDVGSGNKIQVESDYEGLVGFRRYYNSAAALESGAGLGARWSHTYAARLLPSPVHERKQGWVDALRPDGRLERFVNDGAGRYRAKNDASLELRAGPRGWILHHADGRREHYDGSGRLSALEASNAQRTTLAYRTAGPDAGKLHTVTGHFGHALTFEYDTNGRVARVLDPQGSPIVYTYDQGRLTAVTYQDGSRRSYQYGGAGRAGLALTGITDELGVRFARFAYDPDTGDAVSSEHFGGRGRVSVTALDAETKRVLDARGNATTVHYAAIDATARRVPDDVDPPGSGTRTVRYDGRNRPARITDERGNVTALVHDAFHTVERIEADNDPRVRRSTRFKDYLGDEDDLTRRIERPSVAAGRIHTTTLDYQRGTRVPSAIEIDGFAPDGQAISRRTALGYSPDGQLTSIDGPRSALAAPGDTTTLAYWTDCSPIHCGRKGQVKALRDALGHLTRFDAYDAHGHLSAMTDPNGLVTEFQYDPRGRLVRVSESAAGGTPFQTTFTYDRTGQLDIVTLPDGATLDYDYDPAHDLVRVTDIRGDAIVFAYDGAGNRISEEMFDVTDPLIAMRKRTLGYDPRNRVDSVAEGMQPPAAIGYDGVGNPGVLTNARGLSTGQDYDALDRLVRVTDAEGGVTQLRYDVNDRVTVVTDAMGRDTELSYDDLGDLVEVTSPGSGTTRSSYDHAGNEVLRTDARGVRAERRYDALNRLSRITYPLTVPGVVEVAERRFDYDDAAVNGVGRLTGLADESGTTRYAYDVRGDRVKETKILAGGQYVVEYGYDANRRVEQITYPSGAVVDYRRNDAGEVTGVEVTLPGANAAAPLASGIEYLPFGPARSWTYGNGLILTRTFDQQYRMTEITTNGVIDRTLVYDDGGNIEVIDEARSADRSQTFTYDRLDRIDTASGPYGERDYDHDAIGNRTQVLFSGSDLGLLPVDLMARVTLRYGEDNRLREVERDGAAVARYAYNALGERVTKEVAGEMTVYHFDPAGRLLAELGASGAAKVEYVYLNREPLAMIRHRPAPEIYYYHNDHHGTPQKLTDRGGGVVWDADYAPFGAVDLHTEQVENNLRFPGQYFDAETGLHYNYQRDYDPIVGRYTQSDPIGLDGGLNTYTYVGGNPLRFSDLLGLRGGCGPGSRPIPLPGSEKSFPGTALCVPDPTENPLDRRNQFSPFGENAFFPPGANTPRSECSRCFEAELKKIIAGDVGLRGGAGVASSFGRGVLRGIGNVAVRILGGPVGSGITAAQVALAIRKCRAKCGDTGMCPEPRTVR